MDSHKPPQDRLHRQLFQHRQLIEDLLRHFVDEPWTKDLDFTTLERLYESTVTERRDHRLRDMTWSVRWRDRTLYVIVLIEFQSRPDWFMALRKLEYLAAFYQDLVKAQKLEEFNRVVESLKDWLGGEDDAPLRRAFTGAVREALPATGELAPLGNDLIDWDLDMRLRKNLEAWRDEYGAEQAAKAEAIGEARLRAKLRQVLEKQLLLKFKMLSDADRARLDAATEQDLEKWAERILTAATLPAVFLELDTES